MHTHYALETASGLAVATLELTEIGPFAGKAQLKHITVPTPVRGRGVGTQLLRLICNEADLHSKDVYVVAEPAHETTNKALLQCWFEDHDFIHIKGYGRLAGDFMLRHHRIAERMNHPSAHPVGRGSRFRQL